MSIGGLRHGQKAPGCQSLLDAHLPPNSSAFSVFFGVFKDQCTCPDLASGSGAKAASQDSGYPSLFHFCCCGNTFRQKLLRRERVYFSSRFPVPVHRYGRVTGAGALETADLNTYTVRSRERRMLTRCAQSAFSALTQSRTQIRERCRSQ